MFWDFFRIWSIDSKHTTGALGVFLPQNGISIQQFHDAGFDNARIHWLKSPHIYGEELRTTIGEELHLLVGKTLHQLPNEDLYIFSSAIQGEADIQALPVSEKTRDFLLQHYRNRALLSLPDKSLAPLWNFQECSRYASLFENEKHNFEKLVAEQISRNNNLWATQGKMLLSVIKKETNMLVCAEDLGAVPDVVPEVLHELEILSLRIPRWETKNEETIPFQQYTELSGLLPKRT